MTDFLKLILNRFGYWDWTLRSKVGRIIRVKIGLMLGLGKQKTLQATHSRLWRVAECATVAAAGGFIVSRIGSAFEHLRDLVFDAHESEDHASYDRLA